MRQALTILQSIGNDPEGKRLYLLNRLFPRRTIYEYAVKLIDLRYPTAVLFLFKFDCQIHSYLFAARPIVLARRQRTGAQASRLHEGEARKNCSDPIPDRFDVAVATQQAGRLRSSRAGAYPTLPSNFNPNNFVASTAYSIGSSRNTSLQKPLMINETASSCEIPRCWR